ncbi:MAG: hypothetical protein GYA22_14315 [Bacteroidales bacterium]|nr:hypothetical protein [Bacteroidales bacterium]
MATRLDLVIPGIPRNEGDKMAMKIRSELLRLENLLNPYQSNSIVAMVNRFAYFHPVETGSELFHLIRQCIRYWHSSEGLFDISMLKTKQVLKEYAGHKGNQSFASERSCVPSMEAIVLDEEKNAIRFLSPDIQIDTGAFGKGYALDRVRLLLLEGGITNAFISFGESSLLGLGRHPSGKSWQVRLNIPGCEDDEFVLSLMDAFVSVSGNAPKIPEQNPNPKIHLVDPRTGRAVNTNGVVAVMAKSGLESEALSTALFLADPEKYHTIIQAFDCSLVYRIMPDATGKISKYVFQNSNQ